MQDDALKLKMTDIKYLLFDLDGTLIDSSDGIIDATNYALRAIGEPVRKPEEIIPFIGFQLEEMFAHFSSKSYDLFFRYFQGRGVDSIAGSAVPVDGADMILRKLYNHGYKIGIGTHKMRIHIGKIIQKLGWNDMITFYAGADDVRQVKPHPEVYLKVMNLLGGNLRNSLVIGDTIYDVLAARAAGLPVVAVYSPFGNNVKLAESRPDFLIQKISQLSPLLGLT